MVELTILNYLNNSDSIPAEVYMEIPETPPTSFYVMEKTGGYLENHIGHSTIIVQSYAESLYEAAEMNETIKEIMLYELIENDEIVKVSLNSNYNYTDTATKKYRYQAVFDVVHY